MNLKATFTIDDREYTLELTRRAVRDLERSGFDLERASNAPASCAAQLFYAALSKNHRGLDPVKAANLLDRLIDEEGYDFADVFKVLVEMYEQVFTSSETSQDSPKKTLTVIGGKTEEA
jgi:hypothetical protein